MKTIMLATDFSERSDRALRRAILLAKESPLGSVAGEVLRSAAIDVLTVPPAD